jgi:Ca-activated chloride channel family protein
MITLTGGKIDRPEGRKPLRIAAALDCSGSMEGGKLDWAKRSLGVFIDNLTADDVFGLVAFSDSVFSVYDPARMTQANKEGAKAALATLRSRNMTNLSGAAIEIYNLLQGPAPAAAQSNPVLGEAGPRKVEVDGSEQDDASAKPFLSRGFLFTDGLPTAGEVNKDRLIALAGRRPGGASLTTFGYGADHDSDLLVKMAKSGGGNFYYISNVDACPAFFGREFGGLISCVAQGIKVKLTAAPGVRFAKVLNDFDVTSNADGTECTIAVDDVFADEARHIVIELALPEKTKAVTVRASKLCDVDVAFTDVRSSSAAAIQTKVKIDYVKDGEQQRDGAKDVEGQIARLQAAAAQLRAKTFADRGDFVSARSVLRTAQQQLSDAGNVAYAANLGQTSLRMSAVAYDPNELTSSASAYYRGRGTTDATSDLVDGAAVRNGAAQFQQQAGSAVQPPSGGVTTPQDSAAPEQAAPGLAKKRSRH